MAKKARKAARGAKKAARGTKAKKGGAKRAKARPAKRVAAKKPARRVAAVPRPATPRPNPLRELAKRIVAVTVAGDDDATLGFYADTVESVEMGQPVLQGIDAIKQKFQMFRGMTSSTDFKPRSVIVDGNTIVIEWDGTMTLAASGKTVHLREVAVHEIEGGRIVRERYYYDPSVMQ